MSPYDVTLPPRSTTGKIALSVTHVPFFTSSKILAALLLAWRMRRICGSMIVVRNAGMPLRCGDELRLGVHRHVEVVAPSLLQEGLRFGKEKPVLLVARNNLT